MQTRGGLGSAVSSAPLAPGGPAHRERAQSFSKTLAIDTSYDPRAGGSGGGGDGGEDPAGPTVLAVSAVTASATQSPNVATNTLDNNLTTRRSAQGSGQYIQYDLGSTKFVTRGA